MAGARFRSVLVTTLGAVVATASPGAGYQQRDTGAGASQADLESRRAAIEQRLEKIPGHDSTKASIRYPFDLLRVVALGRRPLPGQVDHFDLERELRRSDEWLRALETGRDPLWRATGDVTRHHHFAAADEILPYRLYVPRSWNGKTALPLVLMLHGSGATENTNMDNDGGALPALAERRGFIVVCPLGYRPTGGFGNRSSSFGRSDTAAARGAGGLVDTIGRQRESELSEEETMEVLNLTVAEYGADPRRIYLAGHSMGGGGAWHLAAKYPERWAAVAPMSGPLVDEQTYPFDRLRGLPIVMTDGTESQGTIAASRALRDFLKQHGLDVEYFEVHATHVGMVPMVLPRIFDFFEKHQRGNP
jgi:poly(3-hydroxybutyrate) depolymerase